MARALAMQPSVVLFNEPLSNLDAKLREIRGLQKELGFTANAPMRQGVNGLRLIPK